MSYPLYKASVMTLLITFANNALAKEKVCAEDHCKIIPNPGAMMNDSEVHTRGMDPFSFRRPVSTNSERLLPDEIFTFWGHDEIQNSSAFEGKTIIEEKEISETVSVANKEEIENIRFVSGQHTIDTQFVEKLRDVLDRMKHLSNLRIHFIGHTDSEKLSAKARAVYSDNYGLGRSRAKRTAYYFKEKLNLPDDVISYEGKGPDEPIASNDTLEGMALNRRVEIQVWYDKIITQTVKQETFIATRDIQRTQICNHSSLVEPKPSPYTMTPWRISIDGESVDSEQPNISSTKHGADVQRCTDIALEKAKLQIQYDGLLLQPMLNIAAWPNIAITDETLYFRGWSNYPHWVKRAEVIIYTLGFENQKNIIDRIELNKQLETSWQVPKLKTKELWYSLRVYDSVGTQYPYFDETIGKKLRTAEHYPEQQPDPDERETALRAGYGKNSLLHQTIPINGGTITANGIDVPTDKTVWVMGQRIPLDKKGSFVAQQIIPNGLHTAEVTILDDDGNGELLWRDLEIKKNDWFYVGIADITASFNKNSGSTQLLTGDGNLDDDFSTVGRIAMYAKGKIDDKYVVTTSLDSREESLDKLFTNFHKKDPSSILRRLDSEDYYPTFGDDSTLYEDAPTQGKFYIKVEDEKSHLLWGNFKLNLSENELAVINRGLYGGHARYQSDALTLNGDRQTRLDLFAAEPGTIPSYEEFRGTGGSLYYLKHRDITRGSEQIRIEVRDKDSGIVLSSTPMLSGQDYEIDELQGIILLTSPLASTATGNDLVHSSSLSGHPISMVVNYEYVPGFNELDNIAIGGRAEHWLTDNLQLGGTISNQDQTGGVQKLGSVDVTLKKSDTTWLKITTAQSEGPGITQQQSVDGGFDFNTSTVGSNNKANATRIEGTFSLQEFGIDAPLQSSFYWQERDAGFSAPGQQTSRDVTETGVNVRSKITNKTDLAVRYKERDEKNGRDKQTIEADIKQQLNRNWMLSAGARNDNIEDATNNANQTGLGERTDVVLRADYDSKQKWDGYVFAQGTLDNDKTRQENDRLGVGGSWQASNTLRINGEVSDGDLGTGVIGGAELQATEKTSLYLNYALDSDNSEKGIGGNRSTTILGGRTRFSDYASIYAEEKYTQGNQPRGLTQAYGIDLAADEHWTYGMTLELGKLNSENVGEITRKAVGLRLGYSANRSIYAGAVEFRIDKTTAETRDSWLVRNSYKYQSTPDWRLLSRLDFALSESNKGKAFDADFVEAIIGYAWRPISNDRWNGLFKYTHFYDLTSPDQLTPTEASIDFQQRSHVLAFDLNYDLSKRWTIGGKYAFRRSEIRDRLETGGWFRSDAHLVILRTDWHVVKKWDVLTEARLLDLPDAGDTREGALVAVYRHVNEHFKFGVGYNFTDFSDDLTDLNYDSQGVFINMIGKL